MGDVDLRRQQLEAWAVDWLGRLRPEAKVAGALATVSGDASFRRYFRLPLAQGTLIAVDAPPEKENSRPFVAIARALRAHGVHVPEVIATDFDHGFMLLEDFGDVLLRPRLDAATVEGLYGRAMDTLLHLQACTEVPDHALPHYDRRRLIDEMTLIRDWFIARYLELSLAPEQIAALDQAFEAIAADVGAQPRVFVHRDYHSRNLMLLGNGEIGVIDFQDAVTGPVSYDLVSLLRDAYVSWPAADVVRWVRQYAALLRGAGRLDAGVDDATFQRWFDWMGAQRHLKVVGIFARLSIRDGKHGYLDDIPLVFHYLLAEIEHEAPLRPLFTLLRDTVLPAYLRKKPEAAATLGQWMQ